MGLPIRVFVDAAFAILLAAVLLAVYAIDHRESRSDPNAPLGGPDLKTETTEPVPLKLAVTEAGFDDMGKLLGTLGKGYQFEVVDEKTLKDPIACARFGAVFLTCAEIKEPALAGSPELAAAIRAFVTNGGTLYASDLRFDTLKAAFPEMVDAEAEAQGVKQNLGARVVSPELRDLLGDEMPLHFDLDGWRPAAFKGEPVTVYLRGKFRTSVGLDLDAPLLVKFTVGKGTVVFTSFHNEKQNSALETKLLKHLVFTTVTAGIEATVTRSMTRGGFSLQKTNLLSAAPGDPSVTRTYENAKTSGLAFTLGFEARGAKLKLEVVSPSGERFVKRGDSTVAIDIGDAVAGSWTYTATPESLPYPNFPFTLSVGATGMPTPRSSTPIPTPRAAGAIASGSVRFRQVFVGQVAQAKPQRFAVSKPNFDDMGKLLQTLGDGYKFETIPPDDFLIPTSLDNFDVLFLTCNGWPTAWAETLGPAGDRQGIESGTPRPDVVKRFGETLRRFVNRGGTLYASDMRAEMLSWAFPDREARIELDLAPLKQLDEAEREWLLAKVPLAKVGTVKETLQAASLGPAMTEQFDQILAGVEASQLVQGRINARNSSPEEMTRRLCADLGLPATEADIRAIATALASWEREITEAYQIRARNKIAKAQSSIAQSERRLKMLRDRIHEDPRGVGNQSVIAHILDPGLKELLGPEIPLNFNANAWNPARFQGKDVVEYLRGSYRSMGGTPMEAPLLVKFPEGQGTVIFTSFHNEAQNSRQEEALLKYLVFSAVTAKEQEAADKTMLSGGFPPTKRSLMSHSSGQHSVTKSYKSLKDGPLRFALTFAGKGARLKLALRAPTGDLFEMETQSTLVVEADHAPAGEWLYTVTAIQVPYENFPFSVSVGEVTQPSSPSRPGR